MLIVYDAEDKNTDYIPKDKIINVITSHYEEGYFSVEIRLVESFNKYFYLNTIELNKLTLFLTNKNSTTVNITIR